MKKNLRTILYVMFLTLVATTFVSCGDENDTIYGTLKISGQVTDDQGKPIDGAVITVHNTGEGENSPITRTDAEGNYSLVKIKCTETIYVGVEAEGFSGNGMTFDLKFTDGVPGETLGTAVLNPNFTLRKQ